MEPLFLNYLRNTLGIKGIKRVSMHEPLTNIRKVITLVVERDTPTTEVWRALYGAAVLHRAAGKYVIAVNDDIDPDNSDAVFWAIAFRMNPAKDLQVIDHRSPGHGPEREHEAEREDATLLMDATMKEELPPLALPRQEYMERARKIWEELGLPKLRPQSPWFSAPQGDWLPQWEAAGRRAAEGRYLENGRTSEKLRRKGLTPETRFRPDEEPKA